MFSKLISPLFIILFFTTPLIFFPHTSEIFELNKITFLYVITIAVSSLWASECIIQRKILFRRTILDIPLVLFLSSQLLSTIFSIDIHTSIWGYYSRFNGGLISLTCFSLLYWAFVTFMTKNDTKKIILSSLISATIVSIFGIFEHHGRAITCLLIRNQFNVDCWQQDVSSRVFATFGQPNWLAAYLVSLLPISWAYIINSKLQFRKLSAHLLISSILFLCLLFTKSRSGFLAYIITFGFFWFLASIKTLNKKVLKPFLMVTSISIILVAIYGTSWNQSLFFKPSSVFINTQESSLESGGTESGYIRSIVWQGALQIWLRHPILGTGPETFAYSYPKFRPISHNLTSEWNFVYNKAHNEYLNYAANTGTLGILSYLVLIFASIYQISKSKLNSTKLAILSGHISILITNFFGFSVVTTNLLLFLFPALAVTLSSQKTVNLKKYSPNTFTKFSLLVIFMLTGYLITKTYVYWQADTLYAQNTISSLEEAISINSKEPIYHEALAILYVQSSFTDTNYVPKAISQIQTALDISPNNPKLIKSYINILSDLGDIDPNYLLEAHNQIQILSPLAPTDPSVPYIKALVFAKESHPQKAIENLESTIYLKPDYKKAREFLAFLYIHTNQNDLAKLQYEYILKNISPEDQQIQEKFNSL
jgi:putative inorganic carbon (hco3(-)) transporter